MIYLAVMAGGALGALARFAISGAVGRWMLAGGTVGAPAVGIWGTLAVNVLGCLAMGVLIETVALVWSPGRWVQTFLATGVLGALTTFSAFTLDAVTLARQDQWLWAGGYVALSVLASIGALLAGLALTRAVLHAVGA